MSLGPCCGLESNRFCLHSVRNVKKETIEIMTSTSGATEPTTSEDLLIDFRDVALRRGGNTLVGPVKWQVELDERWVIIGPNGAGKTSLVRMASAEEFPSAGTAFVMGEKFGAANMRDGRYFFCSVSESDPGW